jgi:hypothetical protein
VLLGCSGDQQGTAAGPDAAPPSAAASACHPTHPNASTPPGERRDPLHHGNGRLWTALPPGGRLALGGPLFVQGRYAPAGVPGLHRDGSATTKFYWWGGRAAGSRLRIAGRRIGGGDALRAHVGSGEARSPHFWPSYLTFARSGCWRVSARAGRARLRFRLSVAIPR